MRVLVAGLGIQGSACLHALARRGVDAIGCDLHAPPHTHGSSHGRTRILRTAYYEHPLYVPLVHAALEGWRELEAQSGRTLFRATGVLNLGPDDGAVIRGVRASVAEHRIPHEALDAADVRRRFGLQAPAGTVGIFEPTAGVLAVDSCHEELLAGAIRAGAAIETHTPVTQFEEAGDRVVVRVPQGSAEFDALVLATGPWLAGTHAGRSLGLWVERQVIFWYAIEPPPAFLWEYAPDRMLYTVPGPGARMKAALHHDGARLETPGSEPREEDEGRIGPLLASLLPAARVPRDPQVCHYTNTADGHFIIDRLPGHERVWVVSACSGHGFKFAPAIGARLAGLLLDGEPAGPFAADRPALRA